MSCPEKEDCRYWGLQPGSILTGCMKPRSAFCPADDEEHDEDEVDELDFN
jgi:hypothetical protein